MDYADPCSKKMAAAPSFAPDLCGGSSYRADHALSAVLDCHQVQKFFERILAHNPGGLPRLRMLACRFEFETKPVAIVQVSPVTDRLVAMRRNGFAWLLLEA